jgi:hypothetical protein
MDSRQGDIMKKRREERRREEVRVRVWDCNAAVDVAVP